MGNGLMSIGVRAMAASYAQMQTTSHNIANANVAGFSRQSTMLATAPGQSTSEGFFGRGVNVVGVERAQDAFLTREAASSKALSAMDAVRRDQLLQLESVFKNGEQGIGNSISQFFSAMSDLASRPGDGPTRSVVLSRAQDMSLRFNEAGSALTQLQTSVRQGLQASVDVVNGLAASIAKVNGDIASARGLGQSPNDLLDQRDRLISQLSEHVQVSTIGADDGTVAVFTGGGQRLVLGVLAERLQVVPDLFDSSRAAVAISEGAGLRRLSDDALGGGDIAGMLQFQNKDLVAAQSMLGQLACAVAGAVNEQQSLGLNLQPPAGSVPSRPLFGFVDATREKVLPGATNQRDGSGTLISDVTIEIVDPSQLKATEYELRGDPNNAGAWQLWHVPEDGTAPATVADGDQVDGFVVHFNGGPAAGDRFRLQTVTRAASGLQPLLSNPLDLAAASPYVASAPPANSGTAAVTALRMVSTPGHPGTVGSLTFTGPVPGDPSRMLYDWDVRDSGGSVVDFGSGTWTPGKPIPSLPDATMNGIEIDIAGVPAVGDSITLTPTPHPATNNGNALSLTRLGEQSLVGLNALSDGSLSGGFSFNESFINAMANIGVRTQGAESSAAISGARAEQAESARAGMAGVNLDEEAARLIQFQQSYQSAAKVLQIAQQIFNSMLQIVG